MKKNLLDEIGPWSKIKLDIIREYSAAYSRILSTQRNPRFTHIYIDAFAGPGYHISKQTREIIPGSPLNALYVPNPFTEYHFIDIDGDKVEELKKIVGKRENIYIHEGDCNSKLMEEVLPRVPYNKYRRALCILDPYSINYSWNVIEQIGRMRSVEIFLNFPTMYINRNVLLKHPEKTSQRQIERMNTFWGDCTWQEAAYKEDKQLRLFGDISKTKVPTDLLVEVYRKRLIEIAGFKYVPEPMPMRNTKGAIVYYLLFATHNITGQKIATDIFRKYSNKGKN